MVRRQPGMSTRHQSRPDAPGCEIGTPARWLLLVTVAVAPLLFGGHVPLAWGVNATLAGASALLLSAAYVKGDRDLPVPASWIRLPLAAFLIVVLWIGVQASEWTPAGWHHPVWIKASEALGEPLTGSVSVNRSATWLGLLRLVTVAAAFWLALQIGRDPDWARRILQTVALSASAYTLYGFLATFLDTGTVLWLPKPIFADIATGTFINPNHFCIYAGLGLVAATGLLMRETEALLAHRDLARAGPAMAFSALAATILLGAIIAAGSRAGVLLALAGLAALLVLELLRGRRRRGAVLAGLLLLALAVGLLFSGQGARFAGEVAGTRAGDLSARARVATITLRAIADAPWTGSGYGTFADVFPSYRDGSIPLDGVWLEAHNSYLEAMLGLGVPAALLLFVGIAALVLRTLAGALGRRRDHTAPLVAVAASAIVGLDALVNFSVHLQGVSLTYAALLGCGVAQSWSSLKAVRDRRPR